MLGDPAQKPGSDMDAPGDAAMSWLRRISREQRERFARTHSVIGRLKSSNYDIANQCNLTCEGCLYFSSERVPNTDGHDSDWQSLFRAEADRGINFAYLAGAEPSLEPQRIAMAYAHIPHGVVFTNGTKRIDPSIDYRIHVSVWGLGKQGAALRGADVVAKALRNYRNDRRAVFVYTITPANVGDIQRMAELCQDHGVILTYSFFSATTTYNRLLEEGAGTPDAWSKLAAAGESQVHTPVSLALARAEIVLAEARFPRTVRYSMHYNDWISRPSQELWQLDAEGVAINCGNRLTDWHRHYAIDTTWMDAKCCSPNIDCSDCRAYAMGYASYLTRYAEFSTDSAGFEEWAKTWDLWAELFMPLTAGD